MNRRLHSLQERRIEASQGQVGRWVFWVDADAIFNPLKFNHTLESIIQNWTMTKYNLTHPNMEDRPVTTNHATSAHVLLGNEIVGDFHVRPSWHHRPRVGTCTHVCTHLTQTQTQTQKQKQQHARTHAVSCTRAHTHTCAHAHVLTPMRASTDAHTCECACTHTCACTCARAHAHRHTTRACESCTSVLS